MNDLAAKITDITNKQRAVEGSIAELIADVLTFGCAFEVRRDGHNIVALWREREGGDARAEVQIVVKCGTSHELRDELWDAIINAHGMDTGATEYANAAMERLGFTEPQGGWPK